MNNNHTAEKYNRWKKNKTTRWLVACNDNLQYISRYDRIDILYTTLDEEIRRFKQYRTAKKIADRINKNDNTSKCFVKKVHPQQKIT